MAAPAFDVIVVGGGPAGCSTALSFLRSSKDTRVLVIDDSDQTTFKVGESLPSEATRVLGYLDPTIPGLLREASVAKDHLISTGNSSAWNEPDLYDNYAIMSVWGPGWHLDRAKFDETLRHSVRQQLEGGDRGELLRARWTSIERIGTKWKVEVQDQVTGAMQSYECLWVIDATGRKASVAKKLGARTVKRDDLLAFYTVFEKADSDVIDNDYRTVIEATESGWFYTTQLPKQRRLVVYHTDGASPTAKSARKLTEWLALLHEEAPQVSSLIGGPGYEVLNEPGVSYPRSTAAASSFLEPVWDVTTQWAAVGDAAMAFDPLSSQGMLTALKTGTILGLELARRLANDETQRRSMVDVYDVIGKDFEEKKAHYYGQVRRFDTEFWRSRRGEVSPQDATR